MSLNGACINGGCKDCYRRENYHTGNSLIVRSSLGDGCAEIREGVVIKRFLSPLEVREEMGARVQALLCSPVCS